MGAGESKPAEAVEEVEEVKIADPAPMDKDEVLHTLEKVVSHEYGKIQDELAASATQHAASVKIKSASLRGKFDAPNPSQSAGCTAERDSLIDCLKKNSDNAMECKDLVVNFNMCAVHATTR